MVLFFIVAATTFEICDTPHHKQAMKCGEEKRAEASSDRATAQKIAQATYLGLANG